MKHWELIPCHSPGQLADAVSERWLGELDRAQILRAPLCIALSGGRIAQALFGALVEQSRKLHMPWNGVHFFWADERCVPPENPESNYAVARENLLSPLQIEAQYVHRIRGEDPPEAAAADAALELSRIAPRSPAGRPILDVVFLGMGEEGHVASLFPGESNELLNSESCYRAVVTPKPPPNRVTLGYAPLLAAREVWVLASGPGKEQALRASLGASTLTPLGRLLHLRATTKVFTDIPVRY